MSESKAQKQCAFAVSFKIFKLVAWIRAMQGAAQHGQTTLYMLNALKAKR